MDDYEYQDDTLSESFYSESENEPAACVENIVRMVRIPPSREQSKKRLYYRRVRVQRKKPMSAKLSQSDTEGEMQRQGSRIFYRQPFKRRLSADNMDLEDMSKDRRRRREKVQNKTDENRRDRDERPTFTTPVSHHDRENRHRDFDNPQNRDRWASPSTLYGGPGSEMKLGRNMRAAPRRRCEFAEGVRLQPRDKDLIEMLNRQQQLQVQQQQQQQRNEEQAILQQQAQQIVNEAMLRNEISAKKKKEKDTARAQKLLNDAFPLADVTKTFMEATGTTPSGIPLSPEPESPIVTNLLNNGRMPETEIPRFNEYLENPNVSQMTNGFPNQHEELLQSVSNELERLKTD